MRRLIGWAVVVMGLAWPAAAQTPTTLVQAADVQRLGAFDIPAMTDVETHWSGQRLGCEYTQGVIGFNPANNSLFLVCHDWSQSVAEISIPGASGTASQRQAPRQVADLGAINGNDPNAKKIGGLFVLNGRLLVNAYSFYDANNSQRASLFTRDTALAGAVSGPVAIGSQIGFTSGYLAAIPAEWQAAFGGTMLAGNCCLSIISRTSSGPSVSVYTPGAEGAAKMLLGYPIDHQTLGTCTSATGLFNCASAATGVVFVPGTRSVLFIGTLGQGSVSYKTDTGGYSTPNYAVTVWAYDANDLVAVKNGTKQPWDVRPYATWTLPGLTPNNRTYSVGGAAYDPATKRLYVSQNYGNGTKPRIHVYSVGSGTVTPPPPPPPPVPVDCQVSGWTVGTWSAWTAIDATTEQHTRTNTRTVTVQPANGGAACPGLTQVETETRPIVVAPPPPPLTPLLISLRPRNCTFDVVAQPPTSDSGWGIQFTVNGANSGSRDASAPFKRSVSVTSGNTAQIGGVWTRTGATAVTQPAQLVECR